MRRRCNIKARKCAKIFNAPASPPSHLHKNKLRVHPRPKFQLLHLLIRKLGIQREKLQLGVWQSLPGSTTKSTVTAAETDG